MGCGPAVAGTLRASLATSSASTRRFSSSGDGLLHQGGRGGRHKTHCTQAVATCLPPHRAHPQSPPELHWLPVGSHPSLPAGHSSMTIAMPERRALAHPPTAPVSRDADQHILHLVLRWERRVQARHCSYIITCKACTLAAGNVEQPSTRTESGCCC